MEAGFTTPLLDFFRRGEVDRDIRLQAATGALVPRNHEQLALLMLLTDDADSEVASVAEATLQAIPRDALEGFLARGDTSNEIRAFFAARGVEPAASLDSRRRSAARSRSRERRRRVRLSRLNPAKRTKTSGRSCSGSRR